MKYFCRRCGNEINLKEDRVEGKYLYVCSKCETPQKKKDMIDQAQKERTEKSNARAFEPIYHCDSCDEPIWTKEQLDSLDGVGRCERCQEEYGAIWD